MTNPYDERERALIALGFLGDYGLYLRSDLWASIRHRVLRDNPRCTCCGVPATQVHHTAYDEATLAGTDVRSLISVCGGCHERAEELGKGCGTGRMDRASALLLAPTRLMGKLVKTAAYRALSRREKARYRKRCKRENKAALKVAHDARVVAQREAAQARIAERKLEHGEHHQRAIAAAAQDKLAPRLVTRKRSEKTHLRQHADAGPSDSLDAQPDDL